MLQLMLLLGSALDGYVKTLLGRSSVWRDPFRRVGRTLREAMELVDSLVGATGRLTTTFWVGRWKSGTFRDEGLLRLRSRLDEVFQLRTVQHQLTTHLHAHRLGRDAKRASHSRRRTRPARSSEDARADVSRLSTQVGGAQRRPHDPLPPARCTPTRTTPAHPRAPALTQV